MTKLLNGKNSTEHDSKEISYKVLKWNKYDIVDMHNNSVMPCYTRKPSKKSIVQSFVSKQSYLCLKKKYLV